MSPKNDDFTVDTGSVSALLTGLSGRFDSETPDQRPSNGTTAERHDGTAAVVKPSKYTLLLDPQDALTLDQLALQMRRRTGRRVEKSEILRALIRLADLKPAVNGALQDALDRRPRE
ncbi:hypothetical protein OH736_45925 (plasmid) [Streptomyces sp. NBC_01650]|uniref:hypothetical protein n=1 Tax=Streptomyces sp. NBC_01650 TaxID=2975907 RepID=UPI002F93B62D|nr:hypothetical protein OH736_45925 [Streptomyces sp. NBC_01650]